MKLVIAAMAAAAHLTILGPVADSNGDGRYDSSFRLSASEVSLVTMNRQTLWTWRPDADLLRKPWLLAAGDLNADGIPDYVFSLVRFSEPRVDCGIIPRTTSSLVVVDGRTGAASEPFGPPLADICWDFGIAVYPTDQWTAGTVAIGDFSPAYRGNELISFPFYASQGWAFNYAEAGVWQKVRGRDSDYMRYPSTPEFDTYYGIVNGVECRIAPQRDTCWVRYSHTANQVLVGTGGETRLLVLTSSRALLYGPDLAPTSDTTWVSGNTQNAGRNYGFLFSFVDHGRTYAQLIGGCTVENARVAMTTGLTPTGIPGNCGLHRHFEAFEVAGGRIVSHVNRYYGYSNVDGYLETRIEAPGRANGAIGGPGSHWTVYNLYRDGRWHLELVPDPASPERVLERDGWFAWGLADLNGDGQAELFATRTGDGYVLPWEMDVLDWNGADLVSTRHVDGYVPTLLQEPDTPTQHCYDDRGHGADSPGDSCFDVYTLPLATTDGLLVESPAGKSFWLTP